MNDKIEEMCKAAVDAINVAYEDYDQDSDLYEGFMEGFNAAWKELTAERDRLRKALELIKNMSGVGSDFARALSQIKGVALAALEPDENKQEGEA